MEALQAAERRKAFGTQGPAQTNSYEPTTMTEACIVAWNLMGGEPRVEAIESVAELLGVADVDLLVAGVMTIRDVRAGA